MLPRAAYVDPAVFAWEQESFFSAGWTCVGFSSQLARPGDQRAEPAGQGSVLLPGRAGLGPGRCGPE
jgi:Rieske 2Fe-2S family protein